MPRLTLRDYQEECVQAHYDWFARNAEGNPLFVVPTGGGKSLIIAEFIRRTLKAWPSTRMLVLTHVKELIGQNYEEFCKHWGGDDVFAPAGIYSAGIGRRDTRDRVLFAGIQSVFNKAHTLGHFDLVLIDEAHLVPKKGMGRYRTYIEAIREINPAVRICGYTATHYRLDGGWLHKGKDPLFTAVAYEVKVELLIEKGYLAPLVAKKPEHVIDTTNIESSSGDFKLGQLEEAATDGDSVEAAIAESVTIGRQQGRRHWLVFAIGLKHAKQVMSELDKHGIEAKCVFGNTPKEERTEIVESFRMGKLPALVNVGVLTTGFNAPRLDMMIIMRPTQSAALYVQMMGRGMRTFPGKENCLVLDYGENVERHGPINRVKPKKAEASEVGPPPMKICPQCSSIILLGVKTCPDCGFEWPEADMAREHERVASYLSPVDMDAGKPRILRVSSMFFRRHEKDGKPDTLRVDFMCGMKTVTDWVCLEHDGYAAKKAVKWWIRFGGKAPAPMTVTEALARQDEISKPTSVEVVDDGDYERISRPIFETRTAND